MHAHTHTHTCTKKMDIILFVYNRKERTPHTHTHRNNTQKWTNQNRNVPATEHCWCAKNYHYECTLCSTQSVLLVISVLQDCSLSQSDLHPSPPSHTICHGCNCTHGFYAGISVNMPACMSWVCPHPYFFHKSQNSMGVTYDAASWTDMGDSIPTRYLWPHVICKISSLKSMGVFTPKMHSRFALWSMSVLTSTLYLQLLQLCIII